jgi:hypothetical protein
MGRIGAGGPLRGGAQAALLAAGQVGVDALAPILGKGLAGALTPVGRRIDDMLPGVNSKDEARRVKAKTPLPTMTAAQRAKAVRLPQAKGDPTPKPPAPPKLPAASTTASRPSSNSGSGSNSYSGSSRPSIRAAAASKKAEPGQSKDMNENYRAWAAANPTLAARVKKGQSGYNAFSKDAVAGTGPVKDGNDYKPSVSNSDTANTSSDKDKKKKVNG